MTDRSYTVPPIKHPILDAGSVDTVTVRGPFYGNRIVEIYNRGTSDYIWFTTNGSTPSVAGDGCQFVPPNSGLKITPPNGETATIKLKCATAVGYSITPATS